MTEQLHILRDWTGDGAYTRTFTLEELETIQNTLGMDSDEFSEFITGLSCDQYADELCASLEAVWADMYGRREDLTLEEMQGIHDGLMRSEHEYLTCYTVWRLWNSSFPTKEALDIWKEDCIATLEGIIS